MKKTFSVKKRENGKWVVVKAGLKSYEEALDLKAAQATEEVLIIQD
jgi:hypothetical protein